MVAEGSGRPREAVHSLPQGVRMNRLQSLGRLFDNRQVAGASRDEAAPEILVTLVEAAQRSALASTARSSSARVMGSKGLVMTPAAPSSR